MKKYALKAKACPVCGHRGVVCLNEGEGNEDVTWSGWKQRTYYCEKCPTYFDIRQDVDNIWGAKNV